MFEFISAIAFVGFIFFAPRLLCFVFGLQEAKTHRQRYSSNHVSKKNKAFHYGSGRTGMGDFNQRKPFEYRGTRTGKYTGKYYS